MAERDSSAPARSLTPSKTGWFGALLSRVPPPIRFIIAFLVSLGILALVYPWLSAKFHAQMEMFMAFTAWMVGKGLAILGADVTLDGRFVHMAGLSVEVIEECTGAYEIIIFWAAVIAYPARWRAKAWGIAGGMIALIAINVIRMMFLVAVGSRWPNLFDFLHIYFWQATLILMIVTVWVTWIRLIANRLSPKRTSADAQDPRPIRP